MKIAIYSPYLDTLGGGEKYMMTIAEALSENDFSVDVLLDTNLANIGGQYLKNELAKRFSLDLTKVAFIKAPMGKGSNSFERGFFLKKYDFLFYLTDGSIFYPTAKKNILHIQSPIIGQPAKSIWGKFKLKGWDLIIYNSRFTKENSEQNWPIKSEIIYPPVDVDKIKPLKKKKYILSVGRFFGYLKDKKQELLIKAFRELLNSKEVKDWSLILVGSASKGDEDYINELKEKAKGLPVKFYPNLPYSELMKLYGQASIYWHAAGFEENDPTKMEHFGISTVEAMAGGCVPIVISKGGQTEIVKDDVSGMLWNTVDQLKDLTLNTIKDQKKMTYISTRAELAAKQFNKEKFKSHILKVVEGGF